MYCSSMMRRLLLIVIVRRFDGCLTTHVDRALAARRARQRFLFVRIINHVGYAGNGGVLLNTSNDGSGCALFAGGCVPEYGGTAEVLNVVPTGISGGPRNVGSANT